MILKQLYILFSILFVLTSCGSGSDEPTVTAPPRLITISPADGEKNVSENISQIILTFNENITLKSPHSITFDGTVVTDVKPGIQKELAIGLPQLKSNTTYTLIIPANTIKGPTGVFIDSEIRASFTTQAPPERTFSTQAQKVMDYLKSVYGKKTLSGTMANVSWNTEEADWVYAQTGKYPALNCFDFIHHVFSPANWIDYGNTTAVEEWWNNNGLVAAMWHWCVPKDMSAGNPAEFAFYTEETNFDIRKISDSSSPEYKLVIKDIDIISGYLKLLQSKNIPVIWRPLHEAAGNTNAYAGGTGWFWWGAKGPEPCKTLWKLMFDRMTNHHKLNNLIWVWTTEGNDADWYPGDEYVDLIGMDIYQQGNVHASQIDAFNKAKAIAPTKMVTLSECGGIPNPDEMFAKGDTWLWFMPWYGEHTREEKWNGAQYWKTVMNNPHVITRDQMPSLK